MVLPPSDCRMHDLKKKGEDPQRVGIMVASHNEGTVRYAVERYRVQYTATHQFISLCSTTIL